MGGKIPKLSALRGFKGFIRLLRERWQVSRPERYYGSFHRDAGSAKSVDSTTAGCHKEARNTLSPTTHTHNTHTENTDISRSGSGPKDDPPQLGPDLSDPDGGGGLGSFTANTEEKD